MKWAKGDKVMAKWPGSSLYFHAEVKNIDEDEEIVEVLFEDGSLMDVELRHISTEDAFRPKRSKSPARTRRRSRSPGRSPGRKSRTKAKTTVDGVEKKSPTRGRPKKLPSTESSSSSQEDRRLTVVVKRTETGSSVRQVAEQVVEKKTDAAGTVTVTKSKTLITESPVPDSRYMVTRHRLKGQLAQKEDVVLPSKPEGKSKVHEQEFGGVLGTFLIYATIPILPCLVVLGCDAKDCSVTKFNISMIPCTLKGYYDPQSVMIFFGFLLFHAIIYALPFGYILEGPPTPYGKRLPYRISAMYSLVFMLLGYGLLYYYKIPVASIVHAKMFTIVVTASVFSYLATAFFYLRTLGLPEEELNPRANTGSPIYDSFLGRELHPRFGSLFDLKLYLYRPSMGGWLMMVLVQMHRIYEQNNGEIPPLLLLIGVSQIIYIVLEFFWDEAQCPFMFDIKNDGLGFSQFFGELVLVPFVYSLVVRYVADHPKELSNLSMALVVVCYVAGMIFIVLSGIQKSRFRHNPYDPRLANMESLPPSKPDGYRLLVSGLWGVVRHPNYLGEILVGVGWSFACGFDHLLPWYYPVFVIVLLCHRALRCDQQSEEKHGHAWTVYCQRVKYRVIPYVF